MYIGLISIDEAEKYEVAQLVASGCGITSLLNVLILLKIVENDKINQLDWKSCVVRSRLNDSPLPQYLKSRMNAGCTGLELVESMELLTEANPLYLSTTHIQGKFVPFQELLRSCQSLIEYCSHYLQNNSCVVVTLNLQLVGNDAWHHQVVYGVDSEKRLLYCLNPVCCYSEDIAGAFMSTDSKLLIKTEDILSRYYRNGGDESIYEETRWKELQVKEQIENIVKLNSTIESDSNNYTLDSNLDSDSRICSINSLPSYVVIPADYIGGITVFTST